MTLLYHDDRFLLHNTGNHPECAARLKHVASRLDESGLLNNVTRCSAQPVELPLVAEIHDADYVKTLQEFSTDGGGRIETDTVVSDDSFDVAQLAAGSGVDAVDRIIRGEDAQALCLVRPPGHHAVPHGAMGFCLFNNVAVAAKAAILRHDLDRVLIVDWDVHHGNGTQDIFYEDGQVTFFSAHRFPFYPGSGQKSETGSKDGLGSTFNLPLEFGTTRKDYLSAFRSMLEDAADHCRPELVIVSAGFDAHAEDPIGSLGLQNEDFHTLTNAICEVAETHCNGRIVSMLEGGYNVHRLAECVEIHLQTLLSQRNSK